MHRKQRSRASSTGVAAPQATEPESTANRLPLALPSLSPTNGRRSLTNHFGIDRLFVKTATVLAARRRAHRDQLKTPVRRQRQTDRRYLGVR
jgi:hypothetical protein